MHEIFSLWSSESLVRTATTRGSILPALRSAIPTESNSRFLFLSSAAPSGDSAPPVPSWPYSVGSIGRRWPPWLAWSAASAAAPDDLPEGSTGGAPGVSTAAGGAEGVPGAGAAAGSAAATGAAAEGAAGWAAAACSGVSALPSGPMSTDACGVLVSSGRSVALGRSLESSVMSATALSAAACCLASGESSFAIFSAAASAAVFGFAAAAASPFSAAAAASGVAAAPPGVASGAAADAAAGAAAEAGAAPLPPAAAGSAAASAASAALPPSGSGGAVVLGGGARLPPIAGRLTRLRTSPIASGMSSRWGATCSANCMMPTPSIAAAIITPARLDLDSRMSKVIIALPAPICISSASSSSPASRHASAGLRRKRARNAGSMSRRSISFAATSASDEVAIAHPLRSPRPWGRGRAPRAASQGR